jgi:probable F420-dependent oxidoreductase
MKAGLVLPQTGDSATRENVLYIAKEAERQGLNSVWVLERLLWPLKPKTPYGGTPDGTLPVDYQNVLDPLETLTYVAGNTSQISLGTCLIDMLFHNPVVLARRFATLDVLSHERAIAGLGIGWSKDEYEVSGVPYKYRGERANEFLQLLKRIWTDDVVEFKGQFYSLPVSKIGPKPVQKPHPPILLGGFSPKTFIRIVNYADGCIPYICQHLTYPNVLESSSSSTSSSDEQRERSPMTGTIDQMELILIESKQWAQSILYLAIFFLL